MVDFIDYFESRKIRIQDRYPKMLQLLTSHFSLFLKDGEIKNGESATASKLLAVNYKDKSLWLTKQNVFVGSGVKGLLREMRLKPDCPDLSEFYDSVYRYYIETSERMVEYFSKGLKSETVKFLTVLHPRAKDLPLEEARKKWDYLAKKFYNVVSEEEADMLHMELASYRILPTKDSVDVDSVDVDLWWANVAKIKIGDDLQFPVISGFALSLCTMYNSSSEAERDFSKEKFIFEGSRRSKTSQLTLQSKMSVMSAVHRRAKDCTQCKNAIKEKEMQKKSDSSVPPYKCRHCHCHMLEPEESILMECGGGKPSRRYMDDLSEARDESAVRTVSLAEKRDDDNKAASDDLMKEVTKFRKQCHKEREQKEKDRVLALKRLKVTATPKRKTNSSAPEGSATKKAKPTEKTIPALFSSSTQDIFKPL